MTDIPVLLIDDMPSIHEDFRRILEPATDPATLSDAERELFGTRAAPRTHFKLDCAASGEDGLRLARSALLQGRPYQVAFVDMRMPAGWDGMRTIRELWGDDPRLQIVICTAYSDEPLEDALATLGSSDRLLVLKKPFDPVEAIQMACALSAKWRLALESAEHLVKLEHALSDLRERAAELARSNRDLEQFAYTTSHDLSEPLRMVASFAQLLSRRYSDRLNDEGRDFLGFIIDGAQRMMRLIDDLLAYSRVGRQAKHQSLRMDDVLDDVLSNLRPLIEEKSATIDREPLPIITGDRTAMTQLLQNLIGNALKFQRPNTKAVVRVFASEQENGWTFAVADNGIGIAPEHHERIFAIFQRLHTRDEYDGTGIGLSICKKLVERHGGHIWLESQSGAGTTFFFTYPRQPRLGASDDSHPPR